MQRVLSGDFPLMKPDCIGDSLFASSLQHNRDHQSHEADRRSEFRVGYSRYDCSTYCRSEQNNPHGCACHSVNHDELVELLLRIHEAEFCDKGLAKIRGMLK